jgi:hypothetical protein
VCRKNPNLKVHWELVSTPASGGVAHMLTAIEQHFSTPPALPYLLAPFHPQYLTTPNSTLMAPYFLGLPHVLVLCLVVLLLVFL